MKCGELIHPRVIYGDTLVELGEKDENIVVCDADLSCSTQTICFARKYPNRFFNLGCAEQNLMGFSAGLALGGKTVFTSAFAMFGAGRAWEQIRNTIAYDRLNVKIVLTHAGLTVGKDGASHQITEDLALMRCIPGIKIYVPSDPIETKALIEAAYEYKGPVYVRLTREKLPVIYDEYPGDPDKPKVIVEGDDVVLYATGFMVQETIIAAEKLKEKGISASVVNVQTIKPLDVSEIVAHAKKTGCAVTCEEHSIFGGLGGAVSETLSEKYPVPVERIGVRDRFGKSGAAKDLMLAYNLSSDDIVAAAERSCERKKK